MTIFRPSLQVMRLRVERLNHVVYDQLFHPGVNIISGDNSSGKSTIINLLYYSLGGDVTDWSPVSLLCTRVAVEVKANGKVATFGREISEKSGQPMEIFGGTLAEAVEAPFSEWAKYPYRRSEARESFSQAIFRVLQIPEATSENSGNVTVHQMMRLMYADQLSPVGTLFKFEQFDPPSLRETVGRLIFGANDNDLYSNELRIKELLQDFNQVSSELNSIFKILGHIGQVNTKTWISSERHRLEGEASELDREISNVQASIRDESASSAISLKFQRELYEEVQKFQVKINEQKSAIDALNFEMNDADLFIKDLIAKLQALQDSSMTSNVFGTISFQYCPACYSAIEDGLPAHACHLCKTPFDSERAQARIVKLINDTGRQLKQSRTIQHERDQELEKKRKESVQLNAAWKKASDGLSRVTGTPSTEAGERLRMLQRRGGYVDRQLEDIAQKERLAETLDGLISRKSELNEEISSLRTANDLIAASLKMRLSVAYAEVESSILDMLHSDLPREEAFIHAKSVQFDFGSNKLNVDNESYFSASSRVILRNSFFVGLFAAAARDPSFRHFRLCILDTIEDKGMQDERSHNFQRLIVQVSQAAKTEHQIIFGTSMIAPDLKMEEFMVGHHSTREKRTLALGASTKGD